MEDASPLWAQRWDEHKKMQPITRGRSLALGSIWGGSPVNHLYLLRWCDKEWNYFSIFPSVLSQVHCWIALAVGQKDVVQPPRVRKVSEHVAHAGLYEPPGTVNKVKALERELYRGLQEGAPNVKPMLHQQEVLSETVHMWAEVCCQFYSQTSATLLSSPQASSLV